jgi:hypothetical protein
MPLLNYRLSMHFRKHLCFGQFADLETVGFAQFHFDFHVEHRLTAAVTDMDVDWAVLVAVKEKLVSILPENGWHGGTRVAKQRGLDNGKAAELRHALFGI